jgi:hypothetical protein
MESALRVWRFTQYSRTKGKSLSIFLYHDNGSAVPVHSDTGFGRHHSAAGSADHTYRST